MPFKFEDKLREKANTFIKTLIDAGIDVEPYPAMFRDYMVKLSVGSSGYINIHYSSTKDTFSLKLHELRAKNLEQAIESLWHGKVPDNTEVFSIVDYQAYVDGSHIGGFVGYGAVILHHNHEIERLSGAVTEHVDMHQVAGELESTMCVINWCKQNNITEIEIFYDYEGIQKWATGEWRANKAATQAYKEFIQETPVHVIWQKVKSHTGVHWNDVADDLARQGALSQQSIEDIPDDDPVVELEQTSNEFVSYLFEQDIDASFVQIYNGQFARIVVQGGYFDLYNTRKRPMSPYLHNFKDAELQSEIERHWQAFNFDITDKVPTPVPTGFEEIEYYLTIFEPYRHLSFDFSVLAKSLQPFLDDYIPLPSDNYNELEQIYKQVRTEQ